MQRRETTKQPQEAPQLQCGSAIFYPVMAAQLFYSTLMAGHSILLLCTTPTKLLLKQLQRYFQQGERERDISSSSATLGANAAVPGEAWRAQNLHFLKGWVRLGNSQLSGNCFLQIWSLIPAHTSHRREEHTCLLLSGQLRTCAQGVGKVPSECWLPAFFPGSSLVFLAPQQAAAFVSTTFSPHLLKYAFPLVG